MKKHHIRRFELDYAWTNIGFWSGVGSILNLFSAGTPPHPYYRRMKNHNSDALYSDWKSVGKEFKHALEFEDVL